MHDAEPAFAGHRVDGLAEDDGDVPARDVVARLEGSPHLRARHHRSLLVVQVLERRQILGAEKEGLDAIESVLRVIFVVVEQRLARGVQDPQTDPSREGDLPESALGERALSHAQSGFPCGVVGDGPHLTGDVAVCLAPQEDEELRREGHEQDRAHDTKPQRRPTPALGDDLAWRSRVHRDRRR